MSYPGNASLAQDVKERIANTFQQTLELVTQGKDQEARVGCEFILRMDQEFTPAQTLITRLSSPQRPVVIGDLKEGPTSEPVPAAVAGPSTETPPADAFPDLDDPLDDFEDLADLGELEDLDDLDDPGAVATAAPASGLAAVISDLLRKRNFSQVLQIAESQKAAVGGDPQVQALVETARSRLESDAYVQAFVKSARQAQSAGKLDEMESHLAKARTLDPEHPDVVGFHQQPAAASFDATGASGATGEPAPAAAPESPAPPAREQEPPSAQSAGAEPFAEPDLEIATDDDLELADVSFDPGEPADEAAAAVPAAAAAPAEAPEPILGGGDEGGDRIAELLQEGQEIFEKDDYQAAIDVWSRIFLIDIDNGEASRRIEEARKKKMELERQAEEIFHQASDLIEEGSLEEAKETLRRVLELQPNHSLANEYLKQLEAGQVPAVTRTSDLDPLSDFEALDPDALIAGTATGPSMEAAVERDRIVVVKRTDKRLIALGGLVSLAVIAGAYLLYSKWDDFFPNREAPAAVVRIDPVERATKMHEAGNTENAIILLSRIQPQDPIYNDAQALIEEWKGGLETEVEELPTGPSEEQVRRFNLLIGAAREAHEERQYIRARKYIELASKISPLDVETQQLRRAGDEALRDLEKEIEGFQEGDYVQVIPALWRKREEQPENPDIQLLLVNSYYNLALTDLQRGDPLGAAKKLQEALEVEPGNPELERMQLFAQTYVDRPQDLLYRIYVKYLPSRS